MPLGRVSLMGLLTLPFVLAGVTDVVIAAENAPVVIQDVDPVRPLPQRPPRQKRTTTDGILPLDYPLDVRLKSDVLRVPAAYLTPWPGHKIGFSVLQQKTLSFEFWMPDKRHLEISPISNASFRPEEPGRAPPQGKDYIVRVWDLRPNASAEPDYISPKRAFENRIKNRYPPNSRVLFRDEPFGLVRVEQPDSPKSKSGDSTMYINQDGDPIEAYLNCDAPTRWRIFPPCAGRVRFVSEDVAFFVVFPQEEAPHWRDVILAVRDLYSSWKSP